MSAYLISIDPGVNACGVAVWEGETLLWAQLVKARGDMAMYPKLSRMMRALKDSLAPFSLAHVAIEIPQVYVRARTRGEDPNDLIQLALVVGAVCGQWCEYDMYKPAEWKGQVPKLIMCERIQKHMTPSEIERVILPSAKSLHHNVWDGIGIGLHHLGRL